ncbi:DUF342 domain-containing protein [Shewanella salipaludis]|uniref:DUF342 domain-containing protein n=1 Tax=Shewanella salipaludis TaxID=2723052 RepID=A0A972FV15_9GAMM|nr:FapA family protein [Shewanella salipaludis]NMH65839.1 DUF342 domain-containing protein [Shewanella salipaludis]
MLDPELIELSDDSSKAELRIIPNVHGPINTDSLLQLLTFPGFHSLYPNMTSIERVCKEVNALCGKDPGQHELFFVIAERRDGEIKLDIDADKMHAGMTLTSAWGGREVGLPEILTALKDQKVTMGLSKAKIQALLQQLAQLAPGQSCQGNIAQGKAAINGQDAVVDRKVSLARERLLQPQEMEDGTVDMRNLGAMIMVRPGELLMLKTPATPGTDGYNIHGEVLAAKPGKDAPLIPGDGTSLAPDNPLKLIATVAGQPVETRGGMQVDDVLHIKDVDVGYGHVDFKGSVLITGDVHEGMRVKSSGDITVMGFVDSATLEADGDIVVSKGVIGRLVKAQELSTHIKAKGQICAQFVQYSNLCAKGDVLVTKQLLHSHTQSEASITVSDANGRRGDLVGGTARAAQGIKAVVIGATAGTRTELFCAMNQGELKQELKLLDESVKAIVQVSLDIEARLRKLPPKSEWQNDAAMVEQVRMMLDEKQKITTEKLKEELEYDSCKQEVEAYYQKYRIEAGKQIFVNVELHIGPAFQRTQREYGPCSISNKDQELVFDYSNRGQ